MTRRLFGWLGLVLGGFVVLASGGCSEDNPTTTDQEGTPPRAPSGLYATSTSPTLISLRWRDNSNDETGFRLERKVGSGEFVVLEAGLPANRVTYDDRRAQSGELHVYRVSAIRDQQSSAASNEHSVRAVTNATPAVPFAPQPSDGERELEPGAPVALSWRSTDADNDPITYDLRFGATLNSMTTVLEASTDTTYTVSGDRLVKNSHYFWQVTAHDPKGTSSYSPVWGFNTVVDRQAVAAGRFFMGAEARLSPFDSVMVHPDPVVYVEAFDIDRFEVNNQQFADYLNQMLDRDSVRVQQGAVYRRATGDLLAEVQPKDFDSDIYFSVEDSVFAVTPGRESFPVVEVSWYGAHAYAHHYGRRLPTEAEWEKAARGTSRQLGFVTVADSASVDTVGLGFPFPWGAQVDLNRSNSLGSGDPYEAQGRIRTTPTGFYDTSGQPEAVRSGYTVRPGQSPYGVDDMSGNVWEWCQDWHGPYVSPHQPPAAGIGKILRGGSFSMRPTSTTTFNRTAVRPTETDRSYGFRTVATTR